MYVYCLTNRANGKRYVGKTSYSPKARWSRHRYSARNGGASHFCKAIRKYGPESFDLTVLAEATSEEELNQLEIRFIAEFDTTDRSKGYNLRPGGQGGPVGEEFGHKVRQRRLGTKHSEATRAKMSESQKGLRNNLGWRSNKEVDALLPSHEAPKAKYGSGPTHGRAGTYKYHGCRCDLCTRAKASAARRNYWRKRGMVECAK